MIRPPPRLPRPATPQRNFRTPPEPGTTSPDSGFRARSAGALRTLRQMDNRRRAVEDRHQRVSLLNNDMETYAGSLGELMARSHTIASSRSRLRLA